MATTTTSSVLAQHLTLFPSPLHINKRSRRSARLKILQRKPTRCEYSPHGPLDDIISEITGDLWRSLPEDSFAGSLTLKAPLPWSVAPLPISRTPSEQPLAVRKTRNSNSRSTASGSTFSDAMASSHSRGSGQGGYSNELFPSSTSSFPPLFSSLDSSTFSPGLNGQSIERTVQTGENGAQRHLSAVLDGPDGAPKSRAQLRDRFHSLSSNITNGMEKLGLKKSENRKASASNPNPHESHGPKSTVFNRLSPPTQTEAIRQWLADNGRRRAISQPPLIGMNLTESSASAMQSILSEAANQHPSPLEFQHELPSIDDVVSKPDEYPPVLATSVKIMPEVKVLGFEGEQSFWVGIEIEGVQLRRRNLVNQRIDIVFVIDNAYHITDDCLTRAVSIVEALLSEISYHRTDRIALFTTHCTHEAVTGTVPDMWYPLGTADKVAADIIKEMLSDIKTLGPQARKPPRPNPSMSDVLVAVAKSLEDRDCQQRKAHIFLLSPVARDVHEVSKSHPYLHIHQVNPAVLPFHKEKFPDELACMDDCCANVSLTNMAYYQSARDRMRKILQDARCQKPLGSIHNVNVNLLAYPGCEVLEWKGFTQIKNLRLGQVHSLFVRLKVRRSKTTEMDLESEDPYRDAMLSANNLGEDLKNAKILGASKVHLLSVQLRYQNPMAPRNHWQVLESPLFVFKELGRISPPVDRALDVYKRHFFYMISRLDLNSDVANVDDLDTTIKPELKESAQKIFAEMIKETIQHKAILDYEQTCRQNLPSCPGPVPLPGAHSFLVEKWEARKKKRMGIIGN